MIEVHEYINSLSARRAFADKIVKTESFAKKMGELFQRIHPDLIDNAGIPFIELSSDGLLTYASEFLMTGLTTHQVSMLNYLQLNNKDRNVCAAMMYINHLLYNGGVVEAHQLIYNGIVPNSLRGIVISKDPSAIITLSIDQHSEAPKHPPTRSASLPEAEMLANNRDTLGTLLVTGLSKIVFFRAGSDELIDTIHLLLGDIKEAENLRGVKEYRANSIGTLMMILNAHWKIANGTFRFNRLYCPRHLMRRRFVGFDDEYFAARSGFLFHIEDTLFVMISDPRQMDIHDVIDRM